MSEELLYSLVKVLFVSLGSLATVIGVFVKIMHSQAMKKLDDLISEFKDMSKVQAVHDEKLEVTYGEFNKIELHQKEQDIKIAQLDNRVVVLENIENN